MPEMQRRGFGVYKNLQELRKSRVLFRGVRDEAVRSQGAGRRVAGSCNIEWDELSAEALHWLFGVTVLPR